MPKHPQETGFLNRLVKHSGKSFAFQIYVPRNYSPQRTWPVILFLHGGGERGSDGLLQSEVGIGSAIRRNAQGFPAIVVMPQAPTGERWRDGTAQMAMRALASAQKEFNCDPNRVYLTGLSLGGEGSWYLAYHHTKTFAAAVVVCGFVSAFAKTESFVDAGVGTVHERLAQRLKNLPIWIVHGEADVVVPVAESRAMAKALSTLGAPVQYSEVPGTNHNSWDATYQSEHIMGWMFQQRRPTSAVRSRQRLP